MSLRAERSNPKPIAYFDGDCRVASLPGYRAFSVIPAKAGTQGERSDQQRLGSRFRGNDERAPFAWQYDFSFIQADRPLPAGGN
jgi:hypothetical protein